MDYRVISLSLLVGRKSQILTDSLRQILTTCGYYEFSFMCLKAFLLGGGGLVRGLETQRKIGMKVSKRTGGLGRILPALY